MSARWMSLLVVGLVPLAGVACGDDTVTGTGGGGSGGGSTTAATTTTSGTPTSVSSSSSSTTDDTTTTTTTSDGGGGSGSTTTTTSDGGAGGTGPTTTTSDGGAGGTGSTSTTSDGGGGTGGDPFIDRGFEACADEGVGFDLELGTVYEFGGTTAGRGDDVNTCFDPDPAYDGGDWIYKLNVPVQASLFVRLFDGAGLDGNLAIQTTCGTEDFCYDYSFLGDNKAHKDEVAAGSIYAIVDSLGAAEGEYILQVAAFAPACGDGVLNTGEQCDPGAGTPGDGCIDPGVDGQCTFEPPPPNADVCEGEPFDIPEGVSRLTAVDDGLSTVGFVDDYDGSCTGDFLGLDRVLMLTPGATGQLTITIGLNAAGDVICDEDFSDPACWDASLYVRGVCEVGATELACSDIDFRLETITFDVVEDVPFYLFVDGYDSVENGPFDLDFELLAQ